MKTEDQCDRNISVLLEESYYILKLLNLVLSNDARSEDLSAIYNEIGKHDLSNFTIFSKTLLQNSNMQGGEITHMTTMTSMNLLKSISFIKYYKTKDFGISSSIFELKYLLKILLSSNKHKTSNIIQITENKENVDSSYSTPRVIDKNMTTQTIFNNLLQTKEPVLKSTPNRKSMYVPSISQKSDNDCSNQTKYDASLEKKCSKKSNIQDNDDLVWTNKSHCDFNENKSELYDLANSGQKSPSKSIQSFSFVSDSIDKQSRFDQIHTEKGVIKENSLPTHYVECDDFIECNLNDSPSHNASLKHKKMENRKNTPSSSKIAKGTAKNEKSVRFDLPKSPIATKPSSNSQNKNILVPPNRKKSKSISSKPAYVSYMPGLDPSIGQEQTDLSHLSFSPILSRIYPKLKEMNENRKSGVVTTTQPIKGSSRSRLNSRSKVSFTPSEPPSIRSSKSPIVIRSRIKATSISSIDKNSNLKRRKKYSPVIRNTRSKMSLNTLNTAADEPEKSQTIPRDSDKIELPSRVLRNRRNMQTNVPIKNKKPRKSVLKSNIIVKTPSPIDNNNNEDTPMMDVENDFKSHIQKSGMTTTMSKKKFSARESVNTFTRLSKKQRTEILKSYKRLRKPKPKKKIEIQLSIKKPEPSIRKIQPKKKRLLQNPGQLVSPVLLLNNFA